MKLANADKLEYIKVSSHGLFKVGEKGTPEEYTAVKSPIKIKFDKDILALFYADVNETTGEKRITYSVLHSTERKFKEEYVREVIFKHINYDSDCAMIKFI